MTRIFAFRYSRVRRYRGFLQSMDSLLASHGYLLRRDRVTVRQVYTKRNIHAAAKCIFYVKEDYAELRRTGVIPLAEEKVQILTKKIEITEREYRSQQRPCRVLVEVARRNEFPGLSASVWLKRYFRLFGGFIEFDGELGEDFPLFEKQLRKLLGDPRKWPRARRS